MSTAMAVMYAAVFACLLTLQGVLPAEWGYIGQEGPTYWADTFPLCGRTSQSPINVYEGDVKVDNKIPSFAYQNYDTSTITMTLTNNGHSAVVNLGGTTPVGVSGGGLPGNFRAVQFHFHWGSTSAQGSEHLISSHAYPMELHIVHYNTKYSDIGQAISQADGLAVLGFMFEVSNVNNDPYNGIVLNLANIKNVDDSIELTPVALESLLPDSYGNFYRYSGSLTTPSCQESVTWTVFTDPIKISEAQLAAFRELLDSKQSPIVDNYRPVQPLNTRVVTANFNPDIHWHYNHDGAALWRDYYSSCGKESQSPINIPSQSSQLDATIPSFVYTNYDTNIGINMRIKNNGHAAQVDLETGDVTISGGGLPETYQAAQFHFHWGSTNTQGSEHKVDGVAYPMELHIVHYKKSLGSLGAAVSQPQGLAVLGFFFEVSEGDNEAYKNIIETLPQVTRPDTSTAMPAVALESLLPAVKSDFYRYEGSLTTPTCDQSVIWTVFADPIRISQNQLNAFRQLISAEKAENGKNLPMVNNYRPVQPLNSRIIRRNFEVSSQVTHDWGYKGAHGADNWYQDFPTCANTPTSRQSPIDIKNREVSYSSFSAFRFTRYNSIQDVVMQIKNNGHTIQCDIVSGDIQISGGGLGQPYKAAQFHFHWGSENGKGSEHLVDGKAYPMELHIVHYNTIYPDLGTAASQPNGLAVLGFMFEVSPNPNPNLDSIIAKLADVTEAGATADMPAMLLSSIIPSTQNFYRYSGSLTTPGCYESVIWTVFRDAIPISEEQLQKFRAVKSSKTNMATGQLEPIVDNYRPPQPINTRVVRANFIIQFDAGSTVQASVALLLASLCFSLWKLFS